MQVPYYDHAGTMRAQRDLIEGAIARVLDAGRPDWGAEVPAFEAELAAFCGTGAATAVISGTQALVLALRALGIGPGDEVVTAPNTDASTPSSIRQVGARPVFADIEPATRCLDPAAVDRALGPRVRAVMAVDMHGHPADCAALRALTQGRGIAVIADACISLGAVDGGRMVGTLADVTCVSFGSGKLLGTIGTGGACLASDPALARRLRLLAGYGQDRCAPAPWPYETEAMNIRLPELQAAILRARLPLLPGWLAARRAQAAAYGAGLAGLGFDLPAPRPGTEPAWRNYVIGTDDPLALAARLAARGIETKRLYSPPMYREPGYGDLGSPRDFPVAEREAARLLCLPAGPHLTMVQIDAVIAALREECMPSGV